MIVKDFRKEFYDQIQHQRVLVLVAFDVDAMCACKVLQAIICEMARAIYADLLQVLYLLPNTNPILQTMNQQVISNFKKLFTKHLFCLGFEVMESTTSLYGSSSLFQCDQILYTIVPVVGKEDLERAYLENSEGVKHVIMINCGANFDIVETLQPLEYVKFYICDSHRPVDIHNVYNAIQVKLLMKETELSVPEYDLLFRDEESEDESGNDSDSSDRSVQKKKRFDDEAIERRRERRLWEENRNKVLFDYNQFSSFGSSAALLLFELAWKMSKDSNDLLWLAIIGVTDQLLHYKTPREKYIEDVMALQSHVSRHNHRDDVDIISINCLKIMYDDEMNLSLYRHWSLFDSICHSINMACKFKVWTLKGQKRLHEFLAEMGLPLTQCKQKYSSMDSSLKGNIKNIIKEHMTKYGLEDEDVIVPSFFAQYGFRNKLCAMDITLACASLLESFENGNTGTDSFLLALDVLDRSNVNAKEKGIEMARKQLQAIIKQVQIFLDMHQVISAGPFLYAFIQEGTPDVKFFAHPQCLMRLARFTLEAHCSVSRNKRSQTLPLVLGAPLDREQGTLLVIGIPPLSLDEERKNFFGKAFEQAASSTNARTLHDKFDTFIMEMKTDDRSKFFDALISLLQ